MADQSPPANAKDSSTAPSYEPSEFFWNSRQKDPSIPGRATIVLLRSADIYLQYRLLFDGVAAAAVSRLGGTTTVQPLALSTGTVLGLSPYHALLFGFSVGASLKQAYWAAFICDTKIDPVMSAVIALYNTVINGLNISFAAWAMTSQQPAVQSTVSNVITSRPAITVGVGLYVVGLFEEWYSEIQRKQFKSKPENKGKPYSGGLWSLARNINYGGYTLWRTGFALAAGGWTWAAISVAWFAGDFATRAIPSMDAYCAKRYEQQWDEVRAKVHYKLLPPIY